MISCSVFVKLFKICHEMTIAEMLQVRNSIVCYKLIICHYLAICSQYDKLITYKYSLPGQHFATKRLITLASEGHHFNILISLTFNERNSSFTFIIDVKSIVNWKTAKSQSWVWLISLQGKLQYKAHEIFMTCLACHDNSQRNVSCR